MFYYKLNFKKIFVCFIFLCLVFSNYYTYKEMKYYKQKAKKYRSDLEYMSNLAKENAIANVLLESEIERNRLLLEASELENQNLNYSIGRAKDYINKEERQIKSSYKDKVETINNIKDELKFVGY